MSTENLIEAEEPLASSKHQKCVAFADRDDEQKEYCYKNVTGPTHLVVLMRCGQPNTDGEFCGWYNYPLNEEGKHNMREAGYLLKKQNFVFDRAYCSLALRCQQSLSLILEELDLQDIPITKTWHLNPRHLGAITGMSKEFLYHKYGYDQVRYWLKSNKSKLPNMTENHKLYDSIYNSEDYSQYSNLPRSECLPMIRRRVTKYWDDEIAPRILNNEKILILSHNRALQSLIQHLDDLDCTQLTEHCLPSATPFYYRLDGILKPLPTKYSILG